MSSPSGDPRIIARPLTPGSGAGRTSGVVDREGSAEARVRLVAMVKVLGLMGAFGLALNLGGAAWFEWDETCTTVGAWIDGTLFGGAFVLVPVIKKSRLPWNRLLDLTVAYITIACLSIAFGEQLQPEWGRGISVVALLILLFPLFVPTTLTRIVVAALLAASMPLVATIIYRGYIHHTEAEAVVAPDQWLSVGFNYLVALLAIVPAKIMSKMRRDLSRAQRLGAYELVKRIGKGGMGEVWRARHRLLRRPAAIKLIKPEALGAPDSQAGRRVVDRFEREAHATAMLESPHTVMLYDFGVSEDGVLFHVMELLRGTDLESVVERFGPLPPERVVHVLRQVCDSLDDAHRHGLVHRDIKPANVFLARKGRQVDFVKVLDFGLVKHREVEGDVGATAEGEIAGTPAYMAPELATGEVEPDGRVDLYALGCVGYWLLTGKLVFEGATAMKVAIAHAATEPTPPSERTERPIPPELERVIMSCLAKDREERPRDALALSEMLAACELDAVWAPQRAREWWEANLPEALADEEQLNQPTAVPDAAE